MDKFRNALFGFCLIGAFATGSSDEIEIDFFIEDCFVDKVTEQDVQKLLTQLSTVAVQRRQTVISCGNVSGAAKFAQMKNQITSDGTHSATQMVGMVSSSMAIMLESMSSVKNDFLSRVSTINTAQWMQISSDDFLHCSPYRNTSSNSSLMQGARTQYDFEVPEDPLTEILLLQENVGNAKEVVLRESIKVYFMISEFISGFMKLMNLAGFYILSTASSSFLLYPVLDQSDKINYCKGNLVSLNWTMQMKMVLQHFKNSRTEAPLTIYITKTGAGFGQLGSNGADRRKQWTYGPVMPLIHENSAVCLKVEDNACHDDGDSLSLHHYRVGVIKAEPYYVIEENKNSSGFISTGIIVDILNLLASQLKFNYTFVLLSSYGMMSADGTWDGAVGALMSGEVDFVAADLSKNPARAFYVDFTVPFMQGSQAVVIRRSFQTPSVGDLLRTHLRPFHWSIWLVMGFCLLLTTILLTRAIKPDDSEKPFLTIREGRNVKQEADMTENKETWWSIFFQILGLFCQQGCNLNPVKLSGRVILYTICLTALACYNFYTSVFISFTTVTKNAGEINQLTDVLADKDFQVGFTQSERVERMFKMSKSPLFLNAWARMNRAGIKKYVKNMDEGISRTYNEKFAFIAETNSLEWHTYNNCSFKLLQDRILIEGYYFAFPQGSKDTATFSKYIKRIQESGMVNRLSSNVLPTMPPDFCGDSSSSVDAVGLDRMAGLFFCLGIGFLLSFGSLWLERIGTDQLKPIKKITITVKTKPRF